VPTFDITETVVALDTDKNKAGLRKGVTR